MNRLHQFVAALMILAIVTMLNAPLLACEKAGHRCSMMSAAMMSHGKATSASAATVAKPKHDCCPKDKQPATPKKESCHGNAPVQPFESAASMNCCNMGTTSVVVSVTTVAPSNRPALVAVSDPSPGPLFVVTQRELSSPTLPPYARPVFDLKTDLRI